MPQSKSEKAATVTRLANERAKRSPEQQIELLDSMFGVNQGAVRERTRLLLQIEAKNVKNAKK